MIGTIKKAVSCVLLLASACLLAAERIVPGMSEEELLELRPYPEGVAGLGDRMVYRWPDLEVVVTGGFVEKVRLLDPEAEAAAEEERRQRNAEREVEKLRREALNRQLEVERREDYALRKEAEDKAGQHLKAERARWEFKEREIRELNGSTEAVERWEELRDQYFNALEKEMRAWYLGDMREERFHREIRSRLELDLNRLSDDLLDEDTIDIRKRQYLR
ncbi:MAG: hypothetical protein ACP5I4_13590 [Oceanipulchritudo sp.]